MRTGSQPAVMTAAAVQQLCVCLLDDVVAVVQLLLPAFSDKLNLRHFSAFTRLRSVISARKIIPHSLNTKLNLRQVKGVTVCFCSDSTLHLYCILNCQTDYQQVHTETTETHPMI